MLQATTCINRLNDVRLVLLSKQLVVFTCTYRTVLTFSTFWKNQKHMNISTTLSTKEVENRLYVSYLIQNSVVSNSKEQIAENHRFMYQIICNCDLMIELKEMDLNV